jgi:hypothetical protein
MWIGDRLRTFCDGLKKYSVTIKTAVSSVSQVPGPLFLFIRTGYQPPPSPPVLLSKHKSTHTHELINFSHYSPEDGGNTYLRNVGNTAHIHKVQTIGNELTSKINHCETLNQ